MENLIYLLRARKARLSNSNFCKFLRDRSVNAEDRMVFAPNMLFFVMGFRDTLTALSDDTQHNEFQATVNMHCIEDGTHWDWYLKDIDTLLPGDSSPYNSLSSCARYLWSDENWHIRNMVYEAIHTAKSSDSSFLKLVVIQILEATFDAFNDSIIYPLRELDLFDQLLYFGQHHLDAEEDHAFDDWLKVDAQAYTEKLKNKGLRISPKEMEEAKAITERLMDAFENMFEAWYVNAGNQLVKDQVA